MITFAGGNLGSYDLIRNRGERVVFGEEKRREDIGGFGAKIFHSKDQARSQDFFFGGQGNKEGGALVLN